jgi:hypothetical protein
MNKYPPFYNVFQVVRTVFVIILILSPKFNPRVSSARTLYYMAMDLRGDCELGDLKHSNAGTLTAPFLL